VETNFILDCTGLQCPQPVLRIKKYLGKISLGQTVLVICTDELSMIDVPHFISTTHHKLLSTSTGSAEFRFIIEKG